MTVLVWGRVLTGDTEVEKADLVKKWRQGEGVGVGKRGGSMLGPET